MHYLKCVWPAVALLFPVLGTVMAGEEGHAGRAVQESALASGHASASVAHGSAASGQATSAVSAVPLAVGGAVLGATGAASTGLAGDSMRTVVCPIGSPLPLTDEVITLMPPNEALQPQDPR